MRQKAITTALTALTLCVAACDGTAGDAQGLDDFDVSGSTGAEDGPAAPMQSDDEYSEIHVEDAPELLAKFQDSSGSFVEFWSDPELSEVSMIEGGSIDAPRMIVADDLTVLETYLKLAPPELGVPADLVEFDVRAKELGVSIGARPTVAALEGVLAPATNLTAGAPNPTMIEGCVYMNPEVRTYFSADLPYAFIWKSMENADYAKARFCNSRFSPSTVRVELAYQNFCTGSYTFPSSQRKDVLPGEYRTVTVSSIDRCRLAKFSKFDSGDSGLAMGRFECFNNNNLCHNLYGYRYYE